ncbi:MAG: hypothetical protein HY873_00250 [Chloroflexi bacterium]|nr:hypothetical protein [Chloroflexota bacterium]
MRSNPRRLLLTVLTLAAFAPAVAAACDGDGDGPGDATPTVAAASTPAAPNDNRTPEATAGRTESAEEPTPTGTIEVKGVVGAVDVAARTIEIRPTGDAKFSKIILSPATVIRRANGGEMRLSDVRPSDRIIAFGRPGDDPTALLTTDVTVQQVIPGAQPGG